MKTSYIKHGKLVYKMPSYASLVIGAAVCTTMIGACVAFIIAALCGVLH